MKLLLGWFRSLSQNHPRLALLFSGAKTVGEMDALWREHFVGAEMIWVSFLRPAEARQLITHPVSTFAGEQIFGEQVISNIIKLTHCHPFLIQALCKQLIEDLNYHSRKQAELEDITTAMREIFDTWTLYFWNLWERTDAPQQACLLTIHELERANATQIAERTGLAQRDLYRALEQLRRRDILLREGECYAYAVPLIREWVRENHSLLSEE